MFYVKNDDTDDLFREAAENYELNTENAADWNSVHNAVHNDEPDNLFHQTGKKRRWLALLWFLLVPLGWFANYAWNKWSVNKQINFPAQQVTSENKIAENSKRNSTDTKKSADTISSFQNALKQTNRLASKKLSKQKIAFYPAARNSSSQKNSAQNISAENISANEKFNYSHSQDNSLKNNLSITKTLSGEYNIEPGLSSSKLMYPYLSIKQAGSTNVDLNKKQAALNQNTKSKKPKIEIEKKSYFYAGVSVAPDLSFVEMQKTSPLGYSAGLSFGYRINKRWSVETGILLDRKNYYTKGEYFDKSSLPYGNNIDLLTVDGYCKMFEIPVNVRYNFSANNKRTWYAIGGVSSYLMSEEYYKYDYMYDGILHHKDYGYHHSSQSWLSAINIGAGYEKKISKNCFIKLEPYIKLPVKGIGMGKLSVSSTGLSVGVTKRF